MMLKSGLVGSKILSLKKKADAFIWECKYHLLIKNKHLGKLGPDLADSALHNLRQNGMEETVLFRSFSFYLSRGTKMYYIFIIFVCSIFK